MLNDAATIFLLDVDNTLLDNDRFAADLGDRLESCFGAVRARPLLGHFCARRRSSDSPTTSGACRNFVRGLDDHPQLLGYVAVPARISLREPAVPARTRGDCAPARSGCAGRVVGRRHRVSTAQDPAFGHLGCRRRPRHDLRAQGKSARPRAAALPGQALCYGRRQAESVGGNENGAGRTSDDGIRASRALRAGRGVKIGGACAGSDDRTHRRSSQSRPNRISRCDHEYDEEFCTIWGKACGSTISPAKFSTTAPCAAISSKLSVTGLTSNPTIFDEAIGKTAAYDAGIRQKAARGHDRARIYSSSWRSRTCAAPPICFRPEFDAYQGHRRLGIDGGLAAAGERHPGTIDAALRNSRARQIGRTSTSRFRARRPASRRSRRPSSPACRST